MFRKIFNSLSPMEQFALTLLAYFIGVFTVVVTLTLGFKYITYADDVYNLLGVLLLAVGCVLGVVLGVKIGKITLKNDSEDSESE